jgi:hypothetical protein
VRTDGPAFLQFYEMEDGTMLAAGRIDDGTGVPLPGMSAEEEAGIADLYRVLAGADADPALIAKFAASDDKAREDMGSAELREAILEGEEGHAVAPVTAEQPDVSVRQAASCLQTPEFYAADAAQYRSSFCQTLDGLGSIHCELDKEEWVDGWHRARRYRADVLNQTLCNAGVFDCAWRTGSSSHHFWFNISPREHFTCTWNAGGSNTDMHAAIFDDGGPERPHFCASVNRRK